MGAKTAKPELMTVDEQYQEMVNQVQRWPEWKIQSFCLDQTDIRLLQHITVRDPDLQKAGHA